jgi:hypothetical protein
MPGDFQPPRAISVRVALNPLIKIENWQSIGRGKSERTRKSKTRSVRAKSASNGVRVGFVLL